MATDIGVKKNDYVLKDSLSQFTEEKGSFYSFKVGSSKYYTNNREGELFTYLQYAHIRFRIDIEQETYERTVYSFWDFIGQIGGIYEIFDVLSTVIVSMYTNKMFLVSVLNAKNHSLVTQNKADPIYRKLKRQRNYNRLMEEEKLNQGENNNEQSDNERQQDYANRNSIMVKFTILDAIISSCKCKSKSSNKVKNLGQDQNDKNSQAPFNFDFECSKLNDDLDIITLASMK